MKRIFLVVLFLLALAAPGFAKFGFVRIGVPILPAATIASIALSNNTFLSGVSNTTVGNVAANLTYGTFTGSLAIVGSGGSGSSTCSGGDTSHFQLVSGVLETNGSVSAGTYTVNIQAIQSGISNSPFCQSFSVTGAAQVISSIAPTSCTFTNGTAGSCDLTITMNPTSPSYSGTISLSSATGCSGANDSTFGVSQSPYAITAASTVAVGTYTVCVEASESGLSSLYQQVSITVNSSTGPTPPAGAQAASYTTLVANYDWTGATQSTVSGSNITLGATSNWLDCAGASSPLWYEFNQSSQSQSSYPPCGDITWTTDSGTPVLLLSWTVADSNNGFVNTTIATGNYYGTGTSSISVPQGAYFDVYARTDSQSVGAYSPSGGQLLGDWWMWPTNNSSYIEFDFVETYANGDTGSDGINNASTPPNYGNPGFDNTEYHEYGFRITTDGTNYGECNYLDGSFNGCGSEWAPGSPNATLRYYPQLLVGHGGPPSATIHWYVQWVRIWSCSSWATGPCEHSVLTTSP